MKSKIIAILKSSYYRPILILALVVGAWMTTATVAHAQITIIDPYAYYPYDINTQCNGLQGFNGTDVDPTATVLYLIVAGGSPYYNDLVYDYDGDWNFEEIPLVNEGSAGGPNYGYNLCYFYDDGNGGYTASVAVFWQPDSSCD